MNMTVPRTEKENGVTVMARREPKPGDIVTTPPLPARWRVVTRTGDFLNVERVKDGLKTCVRANLARVEEQHPGGPGGAAA